MDLFGISFSSGFRRYRLSLSPDCLDWVVNSLNALIGLLFFAEPPVTTRFPEIHSFGLQLFPFFLSAAVILAEVDFPFVPITFPPF